MAKATGMIVDGCAASQTPDSSGEILDIKGCDISDFESGMAVINYEHRGDEATGASSNDIVGKILTAKKVFGPEDCDTERQTFFWNQIKVPFVYFIGRLADGAGHPGAIAAAAFIRDQAANEEKHILRWSIEGTTLKKEGQNLVRSIARCLALTRKPCNRSCDTGVILDPNAPKDWDKNPEKAPPLHEILADTKKFEHPGFMKLGSEQVVNYDDSTQRALEGISVVRKALEAGSYNAAPGTLSGGAALQVEDQGLRRAHLLATAKAAYRDWDKSEPFKKFLKNRLPEASEEFLDRFSDLVDDYHAKKGMLAKKAKEKVSDAHESEAGGDTSFNPEDLETGRPSKPRGTPTPPRQIINPKEFAQKFPKTKGPKPTPKNMAQSYFDEENGVLHTNKGSFPMQIPKGKEYEDILNGPEVQPHHDEAMRHWTNLHSLLEQGKLPPAVAMHAALFSGMSPASAVPMQEIAYSHLQDRLKAGMDPTKPGGVTGADRKAWMKSNLPGTAHLPEYMNEYWKGPAGDATRMKETGEQKGVLYPQTKWNSVAAYHKLHPELMKLLGEHGSDSRAITGKLLALKNEAKKHNNRAKIKEKKTDQRQPLWNEATGRGDVEGFKPKTLRYLLGMLGGGNSHVADTHFVRHAFGLPQDDQVGEMARKELGRDLRPDEAAFGPNQHIKDVLWSSPNAAQIGEGIDRYYQKHHPAVKYAQKRFFGGRDDPQAVFPGFWAHWLSIAPHERQQGIANNAKNQHADHRVYWNAVNQILKHHGLPNTEIKKGSEVPSAMYRGAPLAVRTAAAHKAMSKAFGSEAAMWFYMKHLLPLLMEYKHETPPKTIDQALRKMEFLAIELKKAAAGMKEKLQTHDAGIPADSLLRDVKNPPKADRPQNILFRGKPVIPGEAVTKDGRKLQLLHANPEGYVARLSDLGAAGTSIKLNREHQNKHYHVLSEPKALASTAVVDAGQHGHLLKTPEQHDLIHGMDLHGKAAKEPPGTDSGVASDVSEWHKNGKGKLVYVKGHSGFFDNERADDLPSEPRLEGLYHHMANNFFGLGHFLPNVANFKHPHTGEEHAAIEGLDGAQHHDEDNTKQADILRHHGDAGDLEKLAVMNHVMGNRDRHSFNYMFTPKDKKSGLKMIDHGFTLSNSWTPPAYLKHYHDLPDVGPYEGKKLHPETISWLNNLDEAELNKHFKEQGIPDRYTVGAERKLRELKDRIAAKGEGATVKDLIHDTAAERDVDDKEY